jgi:hypothetical protein
MIAGFDTLVPNDLQILTNLAQSCQTSAMYVGLAQQRHANLGELRRSLSNAWSSELVLGILGRFTSADSVMRLANNWGAVQLYYVLYHATQAFHLASGNTKPTGHPSTQRIFASVWGRPGTLSPWNLTTDANGYGQFPANWQVDPGVGPFSACTPVTCWDLFAMALRTTRRDSLIEAYSNERKEKTAQKRKAWTAQEQARLAKGKKPRKKRIFTISNLTAAERTAVNKRLRAHSLIDYAYRLRIKTNYEDAEMFTEGPQNMTSSGQVNRDIVRLAAASLLITELHIGRLIGGHAFATIANGWLQTHANLPANVQGGLRARRHLLP